VADSPAAIVAANLREAMRFFGQATGRGGIYERDGITVIDSGIDYAVFNISIFGPPPIAGRRDFTTRLKTPEAHFDTRRVRWSHWVCVDLLPTEIRNRADEVFRSHGLRRLTDAPGMIAPRLLPPSRPLPAILWRRVQDTESRLAFAHITSHSFEIPFETCKDVYEPEPAWRGSYRGYVGFEQGQPVCTAAIVVAAGVIGIYSVGTLPGHRRRGLAEALLRAVLADVSSETGMSRFALQSTRAGYHLYRRMGFEDLGRFAVYLT